MQTLPSSSCSSSLPWAVLLIDMNLKNFPKSLDSKTSCLRITIPENLDLALEGLIRKVLREQPKIEEIYAFAADYFDMLLKMRDKVGTKFTKDMRCPFHNDEDAHEMIKLASAFAKPGILKTKMLEVEKIKNSDNKARKKEPAKSKRKSEKTVQNFKQPVEIQKKPELLAKEKKDRIIHEIKPEEQKQLKIEPKTEDVGDDEEFLKSDSIKLLVEKELMDATKPRPQDKEKETEHDTNARQIDKLEESTEKEELCSVIDKDSKKSEIIRTDEIVNKEKENKPEAAAEDKKEEEKNAVEKAEIKIHNTKKDKAQEEEITEVLNSVNSAAAKEIKKELQNNEKTEIQYDTTEIKNENEYVKSIESLAAEEKIQEPAANETEAKIKIRDITLAEINTGTPKEAPEAQNVSKGKSSEGIMELDPEKDERVVQEETRDAAKNKITKEPFLAKAVNLNPDEMCTVVDILSIKTHEKNQSNAEQVKEGRTVEPEFKKKEGVNELKINTDEVLTDKDREGAQTQKSMEAFEKTIEPPFSKKAEEANIAISSNGNEVQEEFDKFIPEKVKIIEKPSDTENSVEKRKVEINVEDAKSDVKATMQEREVESIDSKETELALLKDQKSTEDDLQGIQDNEASQTSKVTGDDLVLEEKTVKEILKTGIENEKDGGTEEESRFKKNPIKLPENEEHVIMPENAEAAKGNEKQPENKGMKLEESSEVTEEELQQVKTQIKAENLLLNHEKTKDNKLEEVNPATNDEKPFEDSSITKERTDLTEFRSQPEVQDEWQKDELKPEEGMKSLKEVEDKVQVTEEKNTNKKTKEKNDVTEFSEKAVLVENPEEAVETFPKDSEKEKLLIIEEATKTLDESEKTETLKIDLESTSLLGSKSAKELSRELNTSMPGGGLNAVTESQHVIKIEEAEKQSEESPYAEGVQIKTIQTHYYDTLQVPIKSTKEYRVHPVKNGSAVDNLLNIANDVLPSDKRQLTETSVPPLDLPQQDDDELYKKELEDSLVTPSSSSSLNVSELSIQTISEMFLNSERQYSARETEGIKFLKETDENCGDENDTEKREVEEIFYKTIVPPPIKATPVAPRDDVEIKEEANVEASLKDEKKQEPSVDSEERADSSNERSVDGDTPYISVEVTTVIETQNLEDKEQEKDGGGPEAGGESDVQIRIEATIDVPEGVVVDVREEKEYTDEVRQHASNEPPTLETVPKDSQTSSGESESTTSSTATEIKRNDPTERLFSSTRTLITTQSLDLDKRNPPLKTRSLSSFRQGVIDFEVWNAIEKELEEAATKIQSNFRGYKTRKKLQRENAVNITTEESSCSTTPVEPESKEDRQQSTGEFHDTIVLFEHPR